MIRNRKHYLQSILATLALTLGLAALCARPLIQAGYAHSKKLISTSSAEPLLTSNESLADTFDICLQDNSTRNILKIDSRTGCYQFIECGVGPLLENRPPLNFTGCGTITREGACWATEKITLEDDSRVTATVFRHCGAITTGRGSATVKTSRIGGSLNISDSSISDNTCTCDNRPTVSFTGTGIFSTTCMTINGIFDFSATAVFPVGYKRGDPATNLVSGVSHGTIHQVDGTTVSFSAPLKRGNFTMDPDPRGTRVQLLGCITIGPQTFKVVIEGVTNGNKGVMNTEVCNPQLVQVECP